MRAYHPRDMVLTTAPVHARWGARVRLAVLVAVALLVAHTAIYAAEDGLGSAFANAMSAGGHDGWWVPTSAVVLVGAALLALAAAIRLVRMEVRARRVRPARARRAEASFRSEVSAIARRLVPTVLVLFALQENLEGLIAHGRVLGIEALVGPTHPLAVPILLLVALGLSASGALVRWRIATLTNRIAHDRRRTVRGVHGDPVAPRWRTVGDLAPRRWMLDRLDAGRAPPLVLPV
jgi:hypothetical protein